MALVASPTNDSQTNNNYLEKDQNLRYLEYEDFSHIGLGFETYTDGIQHPLELRKILIGDLAKEMSVSYKCSEEGTFKHLVHPCAHLVKQEETTYGLSEGFKVSGFDNNLPKPPKLIKAGVSKPTPSLSFASSLLSTPSPFMGGLWDTESASSVAMIPEHHHHPVASRHQDFEDTINSIVSNRRPGRPPAANQGTFDPESGTIRYLCRLECGASLASAKGRRKHEKKHCPNMPKENEMGNMMTSSSTFTPVQQAHPTPSVVTASLFGANHLLAGHSLFSPQIGRLQVKPREHFECRICGKVLKTYEGRRIHEKIQHAPGLKRKEGDICEDLEDGEISGVQHISEDDYDDDITDDAQVIIDESQLIQDMQEDL